jgi:phosphatidate cytidylyltransferase
VLIVFVTALIYVFPEWLFCLVVTLFVAVGQFELFNIVEARKIFVYKYFGTIVGALIPVVIYMGNSFPDLKNLEPILIVTASLFALTLQFLRRDNAKDHLVSTALTMFALLYVGWFFSFLVQIRALHNGANLVMFLVLVTKSADMGAYAIGRAFGRHELIPRISPNKTKEGTIGGILVSLVVAVLAGRYLTVFSPEHLFFLGITIATLGQVGDLAESLIKRDCSIKDSGSYVLGIGGILDLIDSLIFTAPFFYFYVKIFYS